MVFKNHTNKINSTFLKFAFLTILIIYLICFNNKGLHATISSDLKLSSDDISTLAKIENVLNLTKTLKAKFLQVSSNGEYSEGDLFLKRPGRLRLVYDLPNPLMIVADGTYISFVDRDLEHSTTGGIRLGIQLFSG